MGGGFQIASSFQQVKRNRAPFPINKDSSLVSIKVVARYGASNLYGFVAPVGDCNKFEALMAKWLPNHDGLCSYFCRNRSGLCGALTNYRAVHLADCTFALLDERIESLLFND